MRASSYMKKLERFLTGVLLVCMLTACGSSSTAVPAWQEQYDLGMQYLTDGDYASAVVALTTSIETAPKLATLYVARGDAYSAWAEETQNAALEEASEAGEVPEWSQITASVADGGTYTLQELYDNAAEDYDTAVSLIESGEAVDASDDLLTEAMEKKEEAVHKEESGKEKLEELSIELNGYSDTVQITSENIFEILPADFTFSSGVGAWATQITLNDDGTFSGIFQDSDMDVVYICEFTGKFTQPQQVSDYIFTMSLDYLDVVGNVGDRYTKDGVLYICSEAYGFDNADEFLIYLPGCPLEQVAEGYLSWSSVNSDIRETIPSGVYGIYNVTGLMGFESTDYDSIWWKTYEYTYGTGRSTLCPRYYSASSLTFWPDTDAAATLILNFDWTYDDQTEFTATDSRGTGEYHIALSFADDYSSVTVMVESLSGTSLEAWGGTADGTLTAEYTVE